MEHRININGEWYVRENTQKKPKYKLGDKWSLGFVAETEHQVCEHLNEHLNELPEQDEKSKAILEQMLIDEGQHAAMAEQAGAAILPQAVKTSMTIMSQVMKKTAYRL
mgnify:CR=1 FL=1